MAYLESRLPDYMVPSLLVERSILPLTANGKIDKQALSDPFVAGGVKESYSAPRTAMERSLAGIWEGLLGVDRVGLTDNFFELGGDSIITIQVVSRARRLGYRLEARDLFRYQQIDRLSAALSVRASVGSSVRESGWLEGPSGLLPIQQGYLERLGV
ncbi:phosphopantetheine-binding protein, partial [Flavitalea flava]